MSNRWERVVSKSAERTRALDQGYKEAKEFNDSWTNIMNWLNEMESNLDTATVDDFCGGDPEKIKQRLTKHREIQKAFNGKQSSYDGVMRSGKALKNKAPKSDEDVLRDMLMELKNKWTLVNGKSVDRQRTLEEALLFSGQFKDAIQALLDWLGKIQKQLSVTEQVYGDFDTVSNLVEKHRAFQNDFESRLNQMNSVIQTGTDLQSKANENDSHIIEEQINNLQSMWEDVNQLANEKSESLTDALKHAENLHQEVQEIMEWLNDAEIKFQYCGHLPEDEQESREKLNDHERFLEDLKNKEAEKNNTIELANFILEKAHPDAVSVIEHYIKVIQSRWEEISTWGLQLSEKLENHVRNLQVFIYLASILTNQRKEITNVKEYFELFVVYVSLTKKFDLNI